ncbi:MAG: hypothetical protein ACJ72B_09830, partial [Ornithinibacter sp.]
MANWLTIRGRLVVALLVAASNFSKGAGYSGVPSPVLHQDSQDRRYQSAHFVLTAPAGPEPGEVLEELERAYRGVSGYGLTLPGRIMAYLYGSSGEFIRGSG